MTKEKQFIEALHQYVNYWDKIEKPKKKCLQGLAFSMLVILDGMSSNFDGDRTDLDNEIMLHEIFYEN